MLLACKRGGDAPRTEPTTPSQKVWAIGEAERLVDARRSTMAADDGRAADWDGRGEDRRAEVADAGQRC